MDTSASVLQGLTLVDFGLGMPAALVSKFLREAGARVQRLEPPDGDPFYSIYPAYEVWQLHKELMPPGATADSVAELVAAADICVIGGEDYPGLEWRFDAREMLQSNPRLIVIDIEAAPEIDGEDSLPAHELLAQARSGFSFENFSNRPIAFNFPVASYGATFNALVGVFTALIHREQTGRGQVVSVSLVEGALDACRSSWFTADQPDPRFMTMVPKDSRMTIFRCGDGKYVHLMMGTPGAKDKFYKLLGLKPGEFADTLNDRGMPTGQGPAHQFWGDIEAFATVIANYSSAEFIALLLENELPCALVEAPGDCWSNPQVAHNGVLETDDKGRQYVGFPVRGL